MNIDFRSNGEQTHDRPDSGFCGGFCHTTNFVLRFFMRISNSWIFNFLIKFIMLGLAFWLIGDQVFDGLQSYTYFIYSKFWNKKWHHRDEAILSNGTKDTGQWEHCEEASLAECWDFITIAMANNTEGDKIVLETKCGTWNIATQTMALNCKLRLNWAYFACSLACWLLPPVAFGSLLTYFKYQVSTGKK